MVSHDGRLPSPLWRRNSGSAVRLPAGALKYLEYPLSRKALGRAIRRNLRTMRGAMRTLKYV